ncbi:MAG: GNAT family N-acetyltransferase [Lysobacter sp.]
MSNPAAPVRIRVAPVSAGLAAAVRALRVTPAQSAYVGDIAFNLADAERDPLSDAMAVLADGRVIGCYRLDFAPNTVAGRDLGEPTLGLRGMLIDRDAQGRGHGALAVQACCEDAGRRHPDRRLLVLAVHCGNHAAIAAYARAGFHDTGERLSGGAAGPQQLMLRRLPRDPSLAPSHSPSA